MERKNTMSKEKTDNNENPPKENEGTTPENSWVKTQEQAMIEFVKLHNFLPNDITKTEKDPD